MVAPYALTQPQNLQPEGEFLLPLCVTKERLQELLNALKLAEIYAESCDESQKWDILEALAHIDDPTTASCYPPCQNDEDTLSDNPLDFLDGIINGFQEGGAVEAIGYVIEEFGRIIVETTLRVVAVTVIGYAVGGILSVFVGGALTATVAVNANETAEIMIKVGEAVSNIIEFDFLANVA